MKNRNIFILLLAILGFLEFACKKNNGGGTPVIMSVRVIDSTKRDSLFIKAFPGTEIVINGTNLGGAQAVYFNDTSAYFNPVYNTDTHIIVVIPATAQSAATNPKVPNLIRVVTSHGTATYTFTLVEPPPYISSITFDNTGTMVIVNGGNFQGIKKISFPGGDTALGYKVNKDFNQISVLIPPGSGITDSLRVSVTYGTASYPFPPPMTITGVSSYNAAPGDTITLTGTNFVVINKVIFPGNIAGTHLNVIDVSHLTVVVPTGVAAPDSLRVNGVLGTVAAHNLFGTYLTHPSPGYLSTFDGQNGANNTDNTGFVGWTGGYADAPTAATAYPGATGSVAFITNSGALPGGSVVNALNNNATVVQLYDVPWVANSGTPIAGYYLKFEVYSALPWKAGQIWIMVGDWFGGNNDWKNYIARFAPWVTAPGGVFPAKVWTTVAIPITDFHSSNAFYNSTYNSSSSSATHFSDFAQTALAFALVNEAGGPVIPANGVNIAFDNVRVEYGGL
jgi:hypothetical protein